MPMLAALALATAAAPAPPKALPGRVYAPPMLVVPPAPQPGPCDAAGLRLRPPGSDLFLCVGRALGTPVLASVDAAGNMVGMAGEIDVPMAIAILADERMGPLWPAVETLLGEGGDALRSAMLDRARAAAGRDSASPLSWRRGTLESLNGASSRAVLDLARVLDIAGRPDDALALLDAQLPALRADGEEDDDREYSLLSNRLRYANLLYTNRRHEEALAALERVERDPQLGEDYRVNAAVNRAAYLAEMGRAAEALALIGRAGERFDDTDPSYAIDGSARQFAWIRACALRALGRDDEARAALHILDRSPERLPSRTGAVVPVTSSIELRAALCLGDVDRLAALLREKRDVMPNPYGHLLQDGWPWAHARNAAHMRAAAALLAGEGAPLPVRQLPAAYAPMVSRAPLGAAPSPTSP